MSKKKRKHHKPLRNRAVQLLPIDDDCTDIPYSLLRIPLTDAAFNLALYLYRYRQSISKCYPGAELLSLSRKMPLDIVQRCEGELTAAGVLLRHEDGTFDMKDMPETKSSL